MAQLPGFIEAQVCKYLGNSAEYLAIRRWESHEAFEGWGKSPQREQYAAARPSGLYTDQPAFLHLEEVLETRGDAGGTFLGCNYFSVDPDRWDEFIDLRRKHDGAYTSGGGVVYLRLHRDTQDPARAVFLFRCAGREAQERITESEALDAWRKTVPEGLMKITSRRYFEIVHEQ
jgi:heme-degrading monooxygenase HmoA